MEPDRFTVVKGNKFASLAPKVRSVSEIHISHKETCYCGCRRVGFGSCARKNMQLCADQKCKATIKTEAQRQAALIYTVARLQSEDTLRLGTTRTAESTSFMSKRACLVDVEASPRVSLPGLVGDGGGTAGSG